MTSAPGTQDDAQTRAPDHSDDGVVAHRVALVTGGTRGIGAAVSRALAQEGASVAAGYWHNQEAAEKFAAIMRADYPRQEFTTHEGNIGVADDCRRVVNEVIEQHGRLDILVNNAGITINKVAAKMSDEDWHRVLDVNLSGAFFISQAATDRRRSDVQPQRSGPSRWRTPTASHEEEGAGEPERRRPGAYRANRQCGWSGDGPGPARHGCG